MKNDNCRRYLCENYSFHGLKGPLRVGRGILKCIQQGCWRLYKVVEEEMKGKQKERRIKMKGNRIRIRSKGPERGKEIM
jgi:hypothetical protein